VSKKKTKIDPTLAEVIKSKMESSGLSQYRIAKDSGVSSGVLNRFMSGERTVSLENADKLCKALGLKLVDVEKSE
jgi:transcriptional regulator with XRE-family HTH domain